MISTCTQTSYKAPRGFDLTSDDDDKELKTWCRIHWHHTLSKGIQGCNAPTYHDCCVSFTKKGCVKKISHPSLQSASVLKIPSLRNTDSPEALHLWLRERLTMHQRLGKQLYFPSINIAHFDDGDYNDEDTSEPVEVLTKRCLKMSDEISELKEQNNKLLGSSKSWHAKYQELLFRVQDDTASYAEITPKKMVKPDLSNEDILSI